ncbi:MAG: TatD family hydrolase [Candidatus Omnitrophica bacterium]|nr:TatD family hydrolase [Candidatus Omnitrophota bacterium]MCB9766679.1 TatD family hydrolase [Candidatus Omnitrophota bacterium]MCB9783729.1 TatD family hydrolase [Candidatus Omnitrophota bacterium]
MIDSHCHLNDERFDEDLDEVLVRSFQAGVRHAIVIGYDLPSSRRAVDLANREVGSDQHPLSAVVGVSTHLAADWSDRAEEEIVEMLDREGVVGLGETGLDDHYPEPPRSDQERSLIAQLEIAMDKKVPVVFHLRDAAEDFFKILDRVGFAGPGVLHCFTGDEKAMRMGIERNLFISYSGIVTFKKSTDLQAVAAKTPLESILVETDSPYLAPVPNRGKRCEPANVIDTAKVVAELIGTDYETLEEQVETNLLKLFPRIGAYSNSD